MYNLSTVLIVSNGYNFTMSSTNATVTCTSATARFEFNTVENVHISGMTFQGCRSGAAEFNTVENVLIRRVTFQGCRNTAITMLQVTSTSIVSCNFIDNQAVSSGSSRYGGCLYILRSSLVTISESEFCNNRAYYRGGAIYAYSSTVRIDRSQFSFNTQVYYRGYGGAINAQQSNITVDSSVFDNNNGGYSGVIYHSSGNFQICNTTFLNNRAGTRGSGGAIHAEQVFTNSSVSQCQFINNIANGVGGAIYTSGSGVSIHCKNKRVSLTHLRLPELHSYSSS